MEYDIYFAILSNCRLLRVTCVTVVFVQNFKILIKFDNQNKNIKRKRKNLINQCPYHFRKGMSYISHT